ncbi:hypothetical protein D3C85_1729640 [compost metagenome]
MLDTLQKRRACHIRRRLQVRLAGYSRAEFPVEQRCIFAKHIAKACGNKLGRSLRQHIQISKNRIRPDRENRFFLPADNDRRPF